MSDFISLLNGGPYIMPRSGVAKSAVLILHGYGADGANLIGLGQAWSMKMPDTVFIAPNAFEHCDMGIGYQWCSYRASDSGREILQAAYKHFESSQHKWDELIEGIKTEFQLEDHQITLVGFSQGAMVSLYQSIYGQHKFAGVVAYSGGFFKDETRVARYNPRLLICHGVNDDVVPVSWSQAGHNDLMDLGCQSDLHLYEGVRHEINEDGFMAGGAFIKDLI